MNNKKRVSAIVTTYKREPKIVLRAVKSIYNQSYPNIEVIVVDDSPSTYLLRDQVRVSLEESWPNIKYVQHEKNKGACAARNTGLKYATGVYVAFLDDDDEWLPLKIEKQVEKIEESDIALVYCGRIQVNESLNIEKHENVQFINGMVYEKLIIDNFIGSTSYPLIKKSVFDEIGGFDEKMQSAQDADVWMRISERYKIDYVEDNLVRYHIHSGEQISSDPKKKIAGLERFNEKNWNYIINDKYAFWVRHMKIIPYYVADKQRKKAFRIWWKCFFKRPYDIVGNIKYLRWIILNKII